MKQTIIITLLIIVGITTSFNINDNKTIDKQPFPDFGYMVSPKEYHGKVFSLSQDYPETLPALDKNTEKILNADYNKLEEYMHIIKEYFLEGNIHNGGKNCEQDFYLEDNKIRNWYHMPWRHWGKDGREGFHGLIRSGQIEPQSITPSQTMNAYVYDIGFFNERGGYTLGKVWPSADADPDINKFVKERGFPVGTVIVNFDFIVALPDEQVPYLKNPIEWMSYVQSSDIQGLFSDNKTAHQVGKVQLMQVDFKIRDSRVDESGGWIFATFVYNGLLENENKWENLVPVGITWGNDPDKTISATNPLPVRTIVNKQLKETVINQSKNLPPMHLGWGMRLCGPIDPNFSSCISCHSTAQYPGVSEPTPLDNSPEIPLPESDTEAGKEWMFWFRNIHQYESFDQGKAISMDFCHSLGVSIENYYQYKKESEKGMYTIEYWKD
jgi:hypothetical protein